MKNLSESIDLVNSKVADIEKFLSKNGYYFEFEFQAPDYIIFNWDKTKKRIFISYKGDYKPFIEFSVIDRLYFFNFIPLFIEAIKKKAAEIVFLSQVEHTSFVIDKLLKEEVKNEPSQ